MSTFIVRCPECGTELEAEDKWIGQKVSCCNCDTVFFLRKKYPVGEDDNEEGNTVDSPGALYFAFDTGIPNLDYTKPVALITPVTIINCESWTRLLGDAITFLWTSYKHKLITIVDIKPDFCQSLILSSDKSKLRMPKAIGKDIFLETNFSAHRVVKVIVGLFTYCGMEPKRCKIIYRKSNKKPRSTKEETQYTINTAKQNGQDQVEHFDIFAIKSAIIQSFPNGFVFNPASIKLLENDVGHSCSEAEILELKHEMFKRSDDVYLLPEMVASMDILSSISNKINNYLTEYGCISLNVLWDESSELLSNLPNHDNDFRLFLLKYLFPTYHVNGKIIGNSRQQLCVPINTNEEDILKTLGERIRVSLVNHGDAVLLDDLDSEFEYLNVFLLDQLLRKYVHDAVEIILDDLHYWKLYEAFCLPDDFNDCLKSAIFSMEQQNIAPSLLTLSEVLSAHYGKDFRELYAVDNDSVFKQIVAIAVDDPDYSWQRNVFAKQDNNQNLNIADEFLLTQHGIFHESDFFEYAKKHRGHTNHGMLILTFLKNKAIRLDKTHWISCKDFDNNSTFTSDIGVAIANAINYLRNGKDYLPLGTLTESFLSSLPVVSIYDKVFYWNHYMLASIAAHRIPELHIVNDDPSPYTVTAMAIPSDVKFKHDVLDYVFQSLLKSGYHFASSEEMFEYLRDNQIRMTKTNKMMALINKFLGE